MEQRQTSYREEVLGKNYECKLIATPVGKDRRPVRQRIPKEIVPRKKKGRKESARLEGERPNPRKKEGHCERGGGGSVAEKPEREAGKKGGPKTSQCIARPCRASASSFGKKKPWGGTRPGTLGCLPKTRKRNTTGPVRLKGAEPGGGELRDHRNGGGHCDPDIGKRCHFGKSRHVIKGLETTN